MQVQCKFMIFVYGLNHWMLFRHLLLWSQFAPETKQSVRADLWKTANFSTYCDLQTKLILQSILNTFNEFVWFWQALVLYSRFSFNERRALLSFTHMHTCKPPGFGHHQWSSEGQRSKFPPRSGISPKLNGIYLGPLSRFHNLLSYFSNSKTNTGCNISVFSLLKNVIKQT